VSRLKESIKEDQYQNAKVVRNVKKRQKNTYRRGPVGKGVKNEKVFVRVVCWYTYILLRKCEFFVTKIFESC
jgi:hypothetical protein